MTKPIRILHLEDKRSDADLVKRALDKSGAPYELLWVLNKKSFCDALKEFTPDIILSDHSLPSFGSLEALKMVKESGSGIPFILITATISDEAAVALMKEGLWDYLIKDRITRLPSAITKALEKYNDLIQKKNAEIAIRESEERYRKIVETAQEGIWTIDEHNCTNFVNKKMASILEYSPEEMIGRKVYDFMDEEGKELAKLRIDLKNNMTPKSQEFWYITKSGRRVWTKIATNPMFSEAGVYKGALAMVTDITEKKKLHESLVKSEEQLRIFARHLNKVQEEERAHLARELHDDLSQELASLKMGLSLIAMLDDKAKMNAKALEMMADVDSVIQTTRRISTELRPGILDSLGLVPSLQWLAKEFERTKAIKCVVETHAEKTKFEEEISNCFFRVCQESLTNIYKHAEASQVNVLIEQTENELLLRITDNGKGIESEKLENPFSMGLLGMRERASAIGADLTVCGKVNAGTTVQLKVFLS
jgi:two-component system sensor histidine kinase UhpB